MTRSFNGKKNKLADSKLFFSSLRRPAVDHSFSTYTIFSEKTNIYYPLTRTRTCVYQGVRNVSFSEDFACVLYKRFLAR